MNEKPQTLTVKGCLRGAKYIAQRNAFIEALRIPTDDDHPGYIDFPFWGRFPVVVDEYHVSENTDEQGQCEISLTLTRAGVTITDRFETIAGSAASVKSVSEDLLAAAKNEFNKDGFDGFTLAAAFGKFQTALLSVLGRVRGAMTVMNTISNSILSVERLIAQGIRAPYDLATAYINACYAMVDGIMEIKAAGELYGEGSAGEGSSSASGGGAASAYSEPDADNEKKALLQFLSASTYTLDVTAATVTQESTKQAAENFFKMVAFAVSARILTSMENLSLQQATGYWNLLQKLEESINQDNPAVHAAIVETRIAVSRELAGRNLSAETARKFSSSLPLLFLAQYLGCDEAALWRLNSIADSFVVEGDVIYV
ncbi:MAG: DNA circularization N-terminal domain-containing protein [Treponematales bacterium]